MPNYEVPQITMDDLMRLRFAAREAFFNPAKMRWHIFAPAILELARFGMTDSIALQRADVIITTTRGRGDVVIDPMSIDRLIGFPVVMYSEGALGGWQGCNLALEMTERAVFFTFHVDKKIATWSMKVSIPK